MGRTLREDVVTREQTPISFNQIAKVVSRHGIMPHLCVVDELPRVPHDRDIFASKDTACLLCTMHDAGNNPLEVSHWVTLMKKGSYYEMYDSLGNTLQKLVHRLNSGTQLLSWAKGKHIRMNTHKHQKSIAHVNDCGCFAAVRVIMKEKNNVEFHRWLTDSFISPDLSVSMMCYLDLLKT